MEYSTQDLVMAAVRGDAVKSAEAFDALITDRIASSIQDRKMELAQRIFNNSQPDADDEDFIDEDDEESDVEVEDEDEEEDENA